ncbi:hypothetical protein BHE74_00040331 [Ensete ventricosum]|nr:hypothetical protein BHE74_00040331 [Ensete ventricosum]
MRRHLVLTRKDEASPHSHAGVPIVLSRLVSPSREGSPPAKNCPWGRTAEIDRRWLISTVPPDSERSTYRYPIGPVHTAHTGRYKDLTRPKATQAHKRKRI